MGQIAERLEELVWNPRSEASFTQLSPDVHLQRRSFPKDISILGYRNLPMVDFDWPDDIHKNQATVRHLGDALAAMNEYADPLFGGSKKKMAVYLTPGGVHGFDLTTRATPQEYFSRSDVLAMQPDREYMELAKNAQHELPEDMRAAYSGGVFNTRVSAKENRQGRDFVAHYLGTIGDGEVNPANASLLKLHDEVVQRGKTLGKGLANPFDDPVSSALVRGQLDTVSPGLVKRWSILKALGR